MGMMDRVLTQRQCIKSRCITLSINSETRADIPGCRFVGNLPIQEREHASSPGICWTLSQQSKPTVGRGV
jgi:hypothetical protein